jgi:hypothetical protein
VSTGQPREGVLRVCLVCTGNTCRSPMAATELGYFLAARGTAGSVVVDSAGTSGWHAGEGTSPAALAALAARGYDGTGHVRSPVRPELARRERPTGGARPHAYANPHERGWPRRETPDRALAELRPGSGKGPRRTGSLRGLARRARVVPRDDRARLRGAQRLRLRPAAPAGAATGGRWPAESVTLPSGCRCGGRRGIITWVPRLRRSPDQGTCGAIVRSARR